MKGKKWRVKDERARGWENKYGRIRDWKWEKIRERIIGWEIDGYRMRKQGNEKTIERKERATKRKIETVSKKWNT